MFTLGGNVRSRQDVSGKLVKLGHVVSRAEQHIMAEGNRESGKQHQSLISSFPVTVLDYIYVAVYKILSDVTMSEL